MGEPEFIELEADDIDFNSPECIEAVHSVNMGFKPHWKAKDLHDYYEDRKLTYEQVRAIVRSENAKAAALDPEFIKEFTRKGEIERKMPDNFEEIIEKLSPRKIPIDEMLRKLKSLLEEPKTHWLKKLVGMEDRRREVSCIMKSGYVLAIDGNVTGIYETDIRNLWLKIAEFTGREQATDEVVRLLHKRVTTSV